MVTVPIDYPLPKRRLDPTSAMFTGGFSQPLTLTPVTLFEERLIPRIANLEQLQKQLNAFLAAAYELSTYGASLPDPSGYMDGSLFVLTTTNQQYQLRSGVWVAI